MANNTETYWEADGQSLHTFARSIETLSGMGPPALRGEDITIPLQPGQTWVPKVHDSNTLTLAMWLRGVAQNAGSGAVKTTKAQYQSNWNDLIRLLWTPGRQIDLTKRFYDGGVLRTATAKAEYAGQLDPTLMGPAAARCTVDLKIAKGLFFNNVESSETLVNGDNTIQVLGNAPTNRIMVTINGARDTVKVRNKTFGMEFTYPRAMLTGQNAVVDIENYTVNDSTATSDRSALINHSGSAQWLTLFPGTNVINLSSASGLGTVTLNYRAAWV